MAFQLLQQPGSIAILDDDPAYLEAMTLALPSHWSVSFYAHPSTCIQALNAQRPAMMDIRQRLHSWMGHWRDGRPLLPQVLQDFGAQAPAYSASKVLVVDYAMPGMNGLEVLQELAGIPAARILLTGLADEQLAIKAFNGGLIEQFLQKHIPDVGGRLKQSIAGLLHRGDRQDSQAWSAIFSPMQLGILEREDVAKPLQALIDRHWVEYVFLSEPFGVLGMDPHGRISWLQLETQASLPELLELAAAQGVEGRALQEVVQQRSLLSLEIQQVLGAPEIPLSATAVPLGATSALLAATFELPQRYWRQPERSYGAFLSTQTRTITD